ncbi:MAG: ion transporter [Rhodothermales bacterium]
MNKVVRFLVKEYFVAFIIVLNTIALILDGFPKIHAVYGEMLHGFDYACMLFYVFEVIAKSRILGLRGYWASAWNKFDFIIVLLGLPLLLDPFVEGEFKGAEVVLLLRMGRFLRFFRMLRFIPNAVQIWQGVIRSLKASVGVFLVLILLNLILAMGANLLFKEYSEEYFGDPYVSYYSMFKVFTIEGWFEIPDELAKEGLEPWDLFWLRCYFSFSVVIGGILGFSLANAVFVDEMTADNNDELEEMVVELREELASFRKEMVDLQQAQKEQLEKLVSK